MKKCFSCGETKKLKAMQMTDCDCDNGYDGFHNHSICKSCYFSEGYMSCGLDMHDTTICLNDEKCENHKDTKLRLEHWDELDYNYKPKKGFVIPEAIVC